MLRFSTFQPLDGRPSATGPRVGLLLTLVRHQLVEFCLAFCTAAAFLLLDTNARQNLGDRVTEAARFAVVANWKNDVFKRSPAKIALPVYSAVTVQVAELQSQKVDEADEAMLSEEYSQ